MSSFAFTTLSGATTTGPGTFNDGVAAQNVTMIVSTTGNPAPWTVVLEGSHDAVVWIPLGSVLSTGQALVVTSTQHRVRYARGNITSIGNGVGTISATIL